MDHEYLNFVQKVEEVAKDQIPEFDMPYRELGFSGTPHRSAVFLQPTRECLVQLVEAPFTVIALTDVEVVNMERVRGGLQNFDVVIVYKDFSFTHINMIDKGDLQKIQDWLDRYVFCFFFCYIL